MAPQQLDPTFISHENQSIFTFHFSPFPLFPIHSPPPHSPRGSCKKFEFVTYLGTSISAYCLIWDPTQIFQFNAPVLLLSYVEKFWIFTADYVLVPLHANIFPP